MHVPVIEPESGLLMTTILAQSGPVIVRFSDRFLDPERGDWRNISFRGVAVAVQNGDGSWHAKLYRPKRRQRVEELHHALALAWCRGSIEGAWLP